MSIKRQMSSSHSYNLKIFSSRTKLISMTLGIYQKSLRLDSNGICKMLNNQALFLVLKSQSLHLIKISFKLG